MGVLVSELLDAIEYQPPTGTIYVICKNCNDLPWNHVDGRCCNAPTKYLSGNRGIQLRKRYVVPNTTADAHIPAYVGYVVKDFFVHEGSKYYMWVGDMNVPPLDCEEDQTEALWWIHYAILRGWV